MKKLTYEEFASSLPAVLDALERDGEPLLVQQNGRLFRVELVADPDARPKLPPVDPEAQRRAFEAARGLLKGIDREAFKKEIRRRRHLPDR